jgi:hypothetical protein
MDWQTSSSNVRSSPPEPCPAESRSLPPGSIGRIDFRFSNAPDEQIGHVRKGGSTGATVRLVAPVNGNKGYVVVSSGEKETIFDVAENLGRDVPIENTPFTLRIENYWPDFRIENGKPSSFSDEPNNPAVLVTLLGKAVPVSEANQSAWRRQRTDYHGRAPNDACTRGGSAKSSHVVYRR